ncbi:hypothetical protein NKG05_13650 [Oerskovia sp. M15]
MESSPTPGGHRDPHPLPHEGLRREPPRDRARRARHLARHRARRARRRPGPQRGRKTTTLRMLTTLIAPTSGTATVAGTTSPRTPRRSVTTSGTSGRATRQATTSEPSTSS